MFSNTPIIITLSNLSTILPFLSCIPLFRNYQNYKYLIPLWLYFTLALVTEIIVHVYHLLGEPNVWIIHIYTPVEFALIAYILSTWQKARRVARIIRLNIPLYLTIYAILKLSGLENFEKETINYLSRPISLLLLSGFVFYTLHQIWLITPTQLNKDYRFWILLAMAIYYNGSIIIVAFMSTKMHDILVYLTYMNALLNILQNILFTAGIFCAMKFVQKNLP